jgi:hypothetical protein
MSVHTDAPEIARLRMAVDIGISSGTFVSKSDLRYALARVDESCKGCFVIETVAQQARTIDRLYAMIDDMMAKKRAGASHPRVDSNVFPNTDVRVPVDCRNLTIATDPVTCQHGGCLACAGIDTEQESGS